MQRVIKITFKENHLEVIIEEEEEEKENIFSDWMTEWWIITNNDECDFGSQSVTQYVRYYTITITNYQFCVTITIITNYNNVNNNKNYDKCFRHTHTLKRGTQRERETDKGS